MQRTSGKVRNFSFVHTNFKAEARVRGSYSRAGPSPRAASRAPIGVTDTLACIAFLELHLFPLLGLTEGEDGEVTGPVAWALGLVGWTRGSETAAAGAGEGGPLELLPAPMSRLAESMGPVTSVLFSPLTAVFFTVLWVLMVMFKKPPSVV